MKKIPILFQSLLLAGLVAAIFSAWPARTQSAWNAVVSTSVDTNWSTAANWTPSGVPGATSNVLFLDTATTVPGAIDNVVTANTTVQQLAYHQTNGVHNTLILPGVTLTVSNALPETSLLAGTESTASPNTLMVTNTISGAGGTLTVTSTGTNVGSAIIIRQITSSSAGPHMEVLDMSRLDNFNASVSNLWVGVDPGTATTRPQAMLFLAKTNNLNVWTAGVKSAPAIDVGDTGASPDVNNTIALGLTNNISADTIEIGNQRSGGILFFNPVFTNGSTPSVYVRGHSSPRVSTWNISDNSSATASIGSVSSGIVDFSGGTVNALVNSMTLADGQPIAGSGAGTTTATLIMAAGSLNVNNLQIAYQNNVLATAAANTGTVDINGGTLTVNTNLLLASYGGSGGLSKGTLNITNGTVLAGTITAGGGTSAINLSGGILVVSNTIGSLAAGLSSLSIGGGAILQLPVVSGATSAVVTNLAGDNTGVINIGLLPAILSYPSPPLPLISYQNGSGSGVTFSLGMMPNTFSGYVSNDNASVVWLVVTNGPSLASVLWGGGVNNLWDTNTLNWTNNGVATKYRDLDVVTFDDTAKTASVNITAAFMPSGWTQSNNILNYTFSGTGNIAGVSGLVMDGSASVTLAETGGDSFGGGILANAGTVILDDAGSTISGGLTIASGATVQIGKNDANGTLPAGGLDDEGTLIFDRTDTVFLTAGIPGGGGLTQNGSGILLLGGANTYTGNTTVNAGTLALTNSGSLASSAQVSLSGGKLDVSALAGSTTLAALNMANSTLVAAVNSLQTPVSVSSLTMSGSGNTINVTTLPVVATYPTTITLVQSAGSIGGFNLSVGTLPAGYAGTVSLGGGGTAVNLTLTSGPVGVRPNVTWSGVDALADVSTNWSDNQNWELPGAPGALDNVVFNNTAASASSELDGAGGGSSQFNPQNVNNFVDRDFIISTLDYTNNGGSYQNTAITNGATLTVTNGFTVGGLDGASTAQQEYVDIAGAGATLNVTGTNTLFQVWYGDSGGEATTATLDLSALDNFAATISRLTVGACAVNNAVNRPGGILYLARTNTIDCNYQTTTAETGSTTGDLGLIVGDCNQNAGPISYLYLGQVNTISADTIAIARQKTSAQIIFNPIYANTAPYPSVTFKGYSSSLVANFDVGDGVGNTGTTSGTGDANLAGGFVNATIGTLAVGQASSGASGSGTTTGTLEFDAGNITANTVNVGVQPVTGSKVGVGTITVGTNTTLGAGAVLVANGNLNLGVNAGGGSDAGAAATAGTLNINGGMVQAGNIVAGGSGAQSVINLNSGTLIVTGTAGTTVAPLSSLNLSDQTTLELDIDGAAGVTNIVAASVSTSGTTTLQIGALAGVVTGVTYPLISYTGADPFSGFSLALPAGYTGSLVDNSASSLVGLTLTAVPVKHPPQITGFSVSGTTLQISATNGVHGGPYVLYGTTNLAKPLSQWTPILTNNFNGSGVLNLTTNIINPALPQQFYILAQ